MTPNELLAIVQPSLEPNLEIADTSGPEESDPGELLVAAVDGTDFILRIEVN